MGRKNTRPTISEQTKCELWARTAGRCEFRGCNKLLYKDDLTQQRSNLGWISHIVAFSPDGPRGDPFRSKQLEIDISNLMLTCRDHAKIIDDKALEAEYPVEMLRDFKREHEQRVRMLTEAKEDAQTHVLLLQVPIDSQGFEIDQTAVFRAILPRYSAEEAPICIDLSDMAIPTTSEGFFQSTAQCITERTHDLRRRRTDGRRIRHLSVFALAPVPLLIHLGQRLGDFEHVDLYQRHRNSQDWTWKDEEEVERRDTYYDVFYPPEAEVTGKRKIAVVFSVSALIMRSEVEKALGEESLVYEIRAKEPGVDFLKSRKRLELLADEARKLLEILSRLDHEVVVHLFPALPAPAAIELGRNIKEHHPSFLAYEYQKVARMRVPALVINARSRVMA